MMNKVFNVLDAFDAFVVEVDTGRVNRFGQPVTRLMLEKHDIDGNGERVFDLHRLRGFFRGNPEISAALAAI